MKKLMTIDEATGQPEGSFKKFIEKQRAGWKLHERERKERIKAAKNGKPLPPYSDFSFLVH